MSNGGQPILAIVSFAGWWLLADDPSGGLVAAIAVLIIACPCALGLATPTVGRTQARRTINTHAAIIEEPSWLIR